MFCSLHGTRKHHIFLGNDNIKSPHSTVSLEYTVFSISHISLFTSSLSIGSTFHAGKLSSWWSPTWKAFLRDTSIRIKSFSLQASVHCFWNKGPWIYYISLGSMYLKSSVTNVFHVSPKYRLCLFLVYYTVLGVASSWIFTILTSFFVCLVVFCIWSSSYQNWLLSHELPCPPSVACNVRVIHVCCGHRQCIWKLPMGWASFSFMLRQQ